MNANEMQEIIKNSQLSEIDMNEAVSMADNLVRKQYLSELKNAKVYPAYAELTKIPVGSNVRLFDITSLSFANSDDVSSKLECIYNSVADFDATPIFILKSDGYKVNVYLGVSCNNTDTLRMYSDTFMGSFFGGFSGSEISMLNTDTSADLLNYIFDEESKISAVSAVPTVEKRAIDQGIERLVDGMRGTPFTMVLVSQAVPKENILAIRQSLESIYTQISPFERQSVTLNTSESRSISNSFSLSKNESVTKGSSITENTSISKGKSKTITEVDSRDKEKERNAKNQLIGTAIALGTSALGIGASVASTIATGGTVTTLGVLGGGIPKVMSSLFFGSAINGAIGSAQTLMNGPDKIEPTIAEGENENYSLSYSEAETTSEQKGFSSSKGITDGTTENSGNSLQMTYENKSISNLLKVIDKQIARLQKVEETGGFNTTVYFIAGDNATAFVAANMYKSLLNVKDVAGQCVAVNMWDDKQDVKNICEYLKRLNHPLFRFTDKERYPIVDASVLVATDEVPMYSFLPQKSMPGLPVTSHAEFARDVVELSPNSSTKIEIGKIYHMGKIEPTPVALSKNNLSGHMFVAGTTGTGKSNFCYNLLNELQKTGTKFLVIEPAKGEYSQVFGGKDGVYTFGTNPNLSPLLTINPFSFCDGIHVNEHINHLIEVFNACWPMEAAMPQVLKDGIETIYINHGFNLVTGNTDGDSFPTMDELVAIIPEIMKKSAYSGEVKGNYIGALETRIKSLTTGLYGCMFASREIDNKILFDENVLIDLSRVGSNETKSLIMGMLVLKLKEYRMSNSKMNSELKHVTVLEEAHHLLKACGGVSNGPSLRQMSLEMITNSIAEMRTYGEGFVIADQSPTLMDLSVIRNTNTKVIFKLPEHSDRNCAGHSVSLTDEQIAEISRLETGVAVVYQSNWSNPVLSKTTYFNTDNFDPYVKDEKDVICVDTREICTQYLATLLQRRLSKNDSSSFDSNICKKIIEQKDYVDGKYKEYISIIQKNLKTTPMTDIGFSELCKLVDSAINVKTMFDVCGDFSDIEKWNEKVCKYILTKASLTNAEISEIILICINIYASINPNVKKFYFRYYAYMKNQK